MWQEFYSPLDVMKRLIFRCTVPNSVYRLQGKWFWLPGLLLASKWIQQLDPLPALPCSISVNKFLLYFHDSKKYEYIHFFISRVF